VTLVPFEWNFAPDSERLYTGQYTKIHGRPTLQADPASARDINANPSSLYKTSMEAYWASKALARMATTDFVEKRKPQFDIVNLLPSVVIGVDERLPSDAHAKELRVGARGSVLAPALDASQNSPFPFVGVPVHVADVARAHVDALDLDRVPGNTDYVLSSDTPDGVVWDQDVRSIARKYFPAEVENGRLPLQGSLGHVKWRLDGGETETVFGWKFTSFEETMKDLLAQYLKLQANDHV
jgi:nucleoside-diphosphate-sugar epimerase